MQDFILVSSGAVLGANTRFLIYQRLQKLNISCDFIILLINIFACFCLGLSLSILPQISSLNFSFKLALFFSIGFLGSLSTFSTFVYDLFELFLQSNLLRALNLFVFSVIIGILAFALGYLLGN
tara:strand:- start:976 stop:1347 length:372 start_codon:yes stop_codon:yes gene_type:complete